MYRRWFGLVLASSLFFLSQFYRTSNAVLAPQLIQDLALDTKGLGLLSASFFYAFALVQIPIGILLDKVGPRFIMTTLSLTGVLGAIIFSWSDSLSSGLAGRILLGAGMACNLMGSYKLLSLWFGPRVFATLAGILVAIGTIGNMVATTPLVFLVENMGWRHSFQLIATVNLLLTLLFYVVVRDKPHQIAAGSQAPVETMSLQDALNNIKLLFRLKDYWIISLSTCVRYGTFAAFQALWAGPFLMNVMGYSPVRAGNIILLLNIGFIAGAPTWGTAADNLFKSCKWLVVIGLVALVAAITFIAIIPPDTSFAIVALLFFCFGFSGAAGLVMYPHIKSLVPREMAGAAMTGVNFFTMIGSAVFLQGLGSLMQTLYPTSSRGPEAFHAAFSLCITCLVVVTILYMFTKTKRVEIK